MHDGLSWHMPGHEGVRNLKQNFSTDSKIGRILADKYNISGNTVMFGRNENKHSHSHLFNLGMHNKIFIGR